MVDVKIRVPKRPLMDRTYVDFHPSTIFLVERGKRYGEKDIENILTHEYLHILMYKMFKNEDIACSIDGVFHFHYGLRFKPSKRRKRNGKG